MKKINGWVLPDDDNEFKRHLKPRKVTYYQQNVLDSAYCYVKNYHTVIDIGANIGLHSVRFARVFQNVIAFESVKDNFTCLEQNLKTKKNVTLYNKALGAKNEKLEIKRPINDKNSGSYSLFEWENVNDDVYTEQVDVVVLDDFNLEPDFIKIDVQGFEDKVLCGSLNTLKKSKPVLLLELEYSQVKRRVINLLTQIGYVNKSKYKNDYVWVHKEKLVPNNKPEHLCMAPWTHTYLSPQTERRLCCASREPAQNFEQYIDTSAGTGSYTPMSLEEYWNSERVRRVRRQMMRGELPPECEVCDKKLLNTDVYRDYFWHMFKHRYDAIWSSTDEDGHTTMQPISWDYRFSNLCNFKCRTCGDMLSSAWETEQRQHNMINWNNPRNNWMQPKIKKDIIAFQQSTVEEEFSQAVEEHRVEEIYWVGGEPLMYEQHWRYMNRIVELGDGPGLYARYNTNLSRVEYRGINFYKDILAKIRDYQVCASLDGTGAIGEYIRTGLDYSQWLENFKQGIDMMRYSRQWRIDFTLTLPGLFEVGPIQQLADELGVEILAKTVFTFTPDIVLSPLALPRKILDRKVDEITKCVTSPALRDVLAQLKHRPNMQETWPDEYWAGMSKGKTRIKRLEHIRNDQFTLDHILKRDPIIFEWWDSIPCTS